MRVLWTGSVIAALLIGFGVWGLIGWSVVRHRKRTDDLPKQTAYNLPLEIVYTVLPFLIIAGLFFFTVVVQDKVQERSDDPDETIAVNAFKWNWQFVYPDTTGQDGEPVNTVGTSSEIPILVLPTDRTIRFEVASADVIHSFWVPEFRQKQDLLPDQDTTIWITPTKTGVFPVICTELCGLGHAAMRTQAQVFATPALFAAAMRKAANPPQQSGLQIFNAQGCAGCHTLTAAKATQKIGPNLDNLAGDAKRAGKPLAEFIHESIVSPAAYIEKSCADAMPKNYQELIPSAQLDALVAFLAKSGTKTEPRGCGE
jgi:cytochrome c oxidase subunit 2